MDKLIIIGLILITAIILGWIKFKSLNTNDSNWQLKFVEIWNDIINFFIGGLIAYYFTLNRLPVLLRGEILNAGDFVLFGIFLLAMFGHLAVMSKNITDGIEVIVKRVLDK